MTKKEKLAYEYGKTFDVSNIPEGMLPSCFFDSRMDGMIDKSDDVDKREKSLKYMAAWCNGFYGR